MAGLAGQAAANALCFFLNAEKEGPVLFRNVIKYRSSSRIKKISALYGLLLAVKDADFLLLRNKKLILMDVARGLATCPKK